MNSAMLVAVQASYRWWHDCETSSNELQRYDLLSLTWFKLITLRQIWCSEPWSLVDHEWLFVDRRCPCPGNLSRHRKKNQLDTCPKGRAFPGRLWPTIWWDTWPYLTCREHMVCRHGVYIVYTGKIWEHGKLGSWGVPKSPPNFWGSSDLTWFHGFGVKPSPSCERSDKTRHTHTFHSVSLFHLWKPWHH